MGAYDCDCINNLEYDRRERKAQLFCKGTTKGATSEPTIQSVATDTNVGNNSEIPNSSDCISRQAAIDAINHICPVDTEYDCTLLDRVDVRCVLLDLPTIQPEPQWIQVSERMPEDMQFVLLTVWRLKNEYNHEPFISVGYIGWNHQHWWCAHDGDCEISKVEVIAWMPLPEAYKGG